jgi:hypothetical protein
VRADTEGPVPDFTVSHRAWCSPKACRAIPDHDGTAVYVFHRAIINGHGKCIAALSQREVVNAAGRIMEIDEAYVTVRCDGEVELLHLPAGQARVAGEEVGGEAGAMVFVALAALNQDT